MNLWNEMIFISCFFFVQQWIGKFLKNEDIKKIKKDIKLSHNKSISSHSKTSIFYKYEKDLEKKGFSKKDSFKLMIDLCEKSLKTEQTRQRYWTIFCFRTWVIVLICLMIRMASEAEDLFFLWGALSFYTLGCLFFYHNFPKCWWLENGQLTPEGLLWISWIYQTQTPPQEHILGQILKSEKKTGIPHTELYFLEIQSLLDEKHEQQQNLLDRWTVFYSILEIAIFSGVSGFILWEPLSPFLK